MWLHLLTPLVGKAEEPSELSASSELTDEELRSAFESELQKWKKRKAYSQINASSVGSVANFIGSHVVYKRKTELTTKARIVPWGHCNKDKAYLRDYVPSVILEDKCLRLFIAVELKWVIEQFDIEAAFLQEAGFKRKTYIRAPHETGLEDFLWTLELQVYGLKDPE